MIPNDLCFLSARDAAHLIARKKVSAAEVVDAVLARLDHIQPRVNACTRILAASAREEARRADRAIGAGRPLGPLHGVPFTVKDMIDVAGERITWGSNLFRDNVAEKDARVVARLRAAGAILVGITTMPECGPKATTDSPLWGITRNPWHTERTPGGSAGGAAAALACGGGMIALGTDRAGSVRIPASCCNVVGLKPTLGVVPYPEWPDLFEASTCIGPMARTVADVALAMSVISGADAGDPFSLAQCASFSRSGDDDAGSVKGLRIAWAAKIGNAEIDDEVRSACEKSLAQLREQGAVIEEIEVSLDASADILHVLTGAALHAMFARRIAECPHPIDPSLRAIVEEGGKLTGSEVARATAQRVGLFNEVQRVLASHDYLLTPTLTAPPLAVGHQPRDPVVVNGRTLGTPRRDWFPYCHPFNHTGHPALSLPAGWTSDGLPIGLQIVGPWFGEAGVLRLARPIERARSWPERRPRVLESVCPSAGRPSPSLPR